MTLLDFQLVLRPNLRPPHFASKVSYNAIAATFAASALKGRVFKIGIFSETKECLF